MLFPSFLIWLPLAVQAAPPSEDPSAKPALRRLSWSLIQAGQAWEEGPRALEEWRMGRLLPPEEEGLQVVVELERGWDADGFIDQLERWHPQVWLETRVEEKESSHGALLQLFVPFGSLETLADLAGLRWAREPHRARARAVMTEGYDAMFALDWHEENVSGRKVDVAVLDVGFQGYEELLDTELPASVETSFLSPKDASDHGTAVAEIIHDLAPKADLELITFSTGVEFLAALEEIADSKNELVNGSVGFDNIWHADGSSPYTQGADQLADVAEILYVAAAGNENERYRVGDLSDAGGQEVALDGMSPIWIYTQGGWADVSFRWSDPMGASSNDLDLYVYNEQEEECGRSQNWQEGASDPYEAVSCYAGTGWAQAYLVSDGAQLSGLTGYLYSYYGLRTSDASFHSNLTLPGDTRRGLSVGAVDLPQLDQVAWYSSRGPTDDGRSKPDLVAPATVSTSTYGGNAFAGTSAATPHATGVAALVLNADKRHMTPSELHDWLTDNTVDVGTPGQDEESGAGLLHLDEIPWRGCHCAQAGSRAVPRIWLSMLLLPWLMARRSRG